MSIWLILSVFTQNRISSFSLAIMILVWVGWRPFLEELIYGQLMILLGLLLILAWRSIRQERFVIGGIYLGLVFALKLMAWPIILFFVLKRQWRIVICAAMTVLILNFAAALLLSPMVVVDYYLNVGMSIMPLYRGSPFNFSVWTVGWRLFEGTGSSVFLSIEAPPLFFVPELAPWFTYGTLVIYLICSLWLAWRARSFDIAFGILMGVSILVNPVTWIHYFTWLLFPIILLCHRLFSLEFPFKESLLSLAGMVSMYFYADTMTQIICYLSGVDYIHGVRLEVAPIAALLTYIWPLCVFMLSFMLWYVDHLAMGMVKKG